MARMSGIAYNPTPAKEEPKPKSKPKSKGKKGK